MKFILLALALAGCAYTPQAQLAQEFVESGLNECYAKSASTCIIGMAGEYHHPILPTSVDNDLEKALSEDSTFKQMCYNVCLVIPNQCLEGIEE